MYACELHRLYILCVWKCVVVIDKVWIFLSVILISYMRIFVSRCNCYLLVSIVKVCRYLTVSI